MTDIAGSPTSTPRPSAPRRKRTQQDSPDPDRFLNLAKKLVVENYNQYRDTSRSPELPADGVYIVRFVKVLGNWQAYVASPIVRGLKWEVTYNTYKEEIYIDTLKHLNNVKIVLGDDS